MTSGTKYHKRLIALDGRVVQVDVYRVLDAFEQHDPGCQHAIKKLLMPGQRGKGEQVSDLREAVDAILATIRLIEQKEASERPVK